MASFDPASQLLGCPVSRKHTTYPTNPVSSCVWVDVFSKNNTRATYFCCLHGARCLHTNARGCSRCHALRDKNSLLFRHNIMFCHRFNITQVVPRLPLQPLGIYSKTRTFCMTQREYCAKKLRASRCSIPGHLQRGEKCPLADGVIPA